MRPKNPSLNRRNHNQNHLRPKLGTPHEQHNPKGTIFETITNSQPSNNLKTPINHNQINGVPGLTRFNKAVTPAVAFEVDSDRLLAHVRSMRRRRFYWRKLS